MTPRKTPTQKQQKAAQAWLDNAARVVYGGRIDRTHVWYLIAACEHWLALNPLKKRGEKADG